MDAHWMFSQLDYYNMPASKMAKGAGEKKSCLITEDLAKFGTVIANSNNL